MKLYTCLKIKRTADMDSNYCLSQLNPTINYASSSTLADSSGLLHHELSSTSNESSVHKVKFEDHHIGVAKLEYIHNLQTKKEMNYRSQHHCDHCTYGSKSIFFMLNHVRRHRLPPQLFNCAASNLELYHCKNCDFNFDSIIHLRNHIKEQHSTNEEIEDYLLKSYICSTCSFATGSALESLRHIRTGCLEMNILLNTNILKTTEKERKWFHCEKCTYKAVHKCNLNSHILFKHTDDKDKMWFNCEKCTYKTIYKYGLNKHVMDKHTDDKDRKWFHCEKCTYKAKKKHHLKSHILSKHTVDKNKNWFNCQKCTYKATRKCHLDRHILLKHTEDQSKKWFYCEKCIYKTVQKSHLNRHILSKHSDDNDNYNVTSVSSKLYRNVILIDTLE